MKSVVLFLISGYQAIISPLLHQLLGQKTVCRYEVSCSEYTKSAVVEHGALKGSLIGFRRFLSCSPFTKTYANI